MNVDDIPAKDIINEDPITVNTDQTLAQIKNRMEEHELREIPVLDSDGDLKGVISYRELIRHSKFNPNTTKPEEVMHQPPEIKENSNLVDLADLRVNSGRKVLVDTEDGELKGVVGDDEFRSILGDVKELNNLNTNDLHTYDLKFVDEDDNIEEARHLMLDNNISRLPVTDDDGNLTGILRSTDVLRIILEGKKPQTGGKSGNPSGFGKDQSTQNTQTERSSTPERGGIEKEKRTKIPVREIMSRDPYSKEEHMNAKDAAADMKQNDADEIVFTDGGFPKSIISIKDFVDYLADFAPGKTVLVNLIGLDVAEEKAVVHNKIKKQLRGSLGRKLEKPEELTLRLKKAEKDGKRHRWEMELKLHCEYGILNVEEEGWDLMEALDEALNELNSIVREKKERQKP